MDIKGEVPQGPKAAIKAVYVEQYGAWWKLSLDEWRQILASGAAGNGHTLPNERAMGRRSRLVGATDYGDGEGETSYYPKADGILIYSPLDWWPEDYESALQELNDLQGSP